MGTIRIVPISDTGPPSDQTHVLVQFPLAELVNALKHDDVEGMVRCTLQEYYGQNVTFPLMVQMVKKSVLAHVADRLVRVMKGEHGGGLVVIVNQTTFDNMERAGKQTQAYRRPVVGTYWAGESVLIPEEEQ